MIFSEGKNPSPMQYLSNFLQIVVDGHETSGLDLKLFYHLNGLLVDSMLKLLEH